VSDGYDATVSAMIAGGPPLSSATTATETFGGAVKSAATGAAGAAGTGPLDGALNGFGDEFKTFADERADAVDELRQSLLDSAEQYRSDDGSAAERSNNIDFG